MVKCLQQICHNYETKVETVMVINSTNLDLQPPYVNYIITG